MLTTLELPHTGRLHSDGSPPSTRVSNCTITVSILFTILVSPSWHVQCVQATGLKLTRYLGRPTSPCSVTFFTTTRHMGCNSSKQFVEFEKAAGDIQPERPREPKRGLMARLKSKYSKKATTASTRPETPPPWVRNDHHVYVADPQNVNGGYTVSRDVYYSTQNRASS